MKKYFQSTKDITIWHKRVLFLFVLSSFILLNKNAISQEENKEKQSFSMNMTYYKTNGVRSIKVKAFYKEGRQFIPVEDALVNLFLNKEMKHNEATGDGWISNRNLDNEGEMVIELSDGVEYITKGKYEYTFLAKMLNDPRYEDNEEEITIIDAEIIINVTMDEDSVRTVTAQLLEIKDDSTKVPVPDVELKLFVKRAFSFFPIGEEGEVTDENGEISAEIPSDLPSSDGVIIVGGRIDDHENFGTVLTSQETPWNVLPKAREIDKRTLWSKGKNAPIPLIIASLSIIGLIWGTIIYLLFQLIKIKRLGKTE